MGGKGAHTGTQGPGTALQPANSVDANKIRGRSGAPGPRGARERIRAGLRGSLDQRCAIQSLYVVRTSGPPADWRRVKALTLHGP